MRIVFIGPPGCGKGTQADRLKDHLRVAHLSTGQLLRQARDQRTPLGLQAAEFMQAGRLVPDEVVIGIIRQRINEPDCADGYLLDGFPRTLEQADQLDQLLAEAGTPLDAVLEFRVDQQKLFERLAARGRADDKEETIRERLRQYELLTAPLVQYYQQRGILRPIDGNPAPDEVYAGVRAAIGLATPEST